MKEEITEIITAGGYLAVDGLECKRLVSELETLFNQELFSEREPRMMSILDKAEAELKEIETKLKP